jgi:hypothetical protein
MIDNNTTLPWEQPGWIEEVQSWIEAEVSQAGLRVSAPIDQFHIRPWSTVLRVPTNAETLYFKASAPALSWEPGLTRFLADNHPRLLPDLIATDLRRGWLLMRASGTPLRAYIRSEHSLERWRSIMPLYAGLQKDLADRLDALLPLGVLDRRLELLPGFLDEMLRDQTCLLIDQPEGLTGNEYARLQGSLAIFERMCQDLAAFGIPATLHHDDFHDGNLFLQNERVIFTDWGESAITHPFFSLVVMLRGASNSLNLEPQAPELAQMRDWYLEQWTDYAPLAQLQPIVDLAEKIGLVNRAMTWRHILQHMPAALRPEYASAVPAYLQDFLAALATGL